MHDTECVFLMVVFPVSPGSLHINVSPSPPPGGGVRAQRHLQPQPRQRARRDRRGGGGGAGGDAEPRRAPGRGPEHLPVPFLPLPRLEGPSHFGMVGCLLVEWMVVCQSRRWMRQCPDIVLSNVSLPGTTCKPPHGSAAHQTPNRRMQSNDANV